MGCGGEDGGSSISPTPVNITGTRRGTATSSLTDTPANISMAINQQGTNISGTLTCTGCAHSTGTISGTISGNTLTMGVVWPDDHSCGTFDGTVSGSTLSGQYACSDPDTGDDQGIWNAIKQS